MTRWPGAASSRISGRCSVRTPDGRQPSVRLLDRDAERGGERVRQRDQVVPLDHGAPQCRHPAHIDQFAAREPGTGQVGVVNLGAGQYAVDEPGPPQVGVGEVDLGQVAAVEDHLGQLGEPEGRQVQPTVVEQHVAQSAVDPLESGHAQHRQPYPSHRSAVGAQVRQVGVLQYAVDEHALVQRGAAQVAAGDQLVQLDGLGDPAGLVEFDVVEAAVGALVLEIVVGQDGRVAGVR